MASPHNFTTIAERELDNPDIFLPTSMRYQGEEIIWTKPGYATYRGKTPLSSAIQRALSSPQTWPESLSPRIQRNIKIATFMTTSLPQPPLTTGKQPNIPTKLFLLTLSESGKSHVIDSPQTPTSPMDGISLPFFLSTPINVSPESNFFFAAAPLLHPNKPRSFWKKQVKQANEMYQSWEALYHCVASEKYVPFPKCLWYHKYHYIHQRKQPETWRLFFNDSSFSEWGKNK